MLSRLQRSSDQFRHLNRKLTSAVFGIHLAAIAAIVLEHGFYLKEDFVTFIRLLQVVVIVVFILLQLVKFLIAPKRLAYVRERWIEYLVSFFFIAISLLLFVFEETHFTYLRSVNHFSLYIIIIQVVIGIDVLSSVIRYSHTVATWDIQPARLFLLSFVLLIVIGTFALLLPRATTNGISFMDALFTSTSAVCVTGLIVVDTPTAFTPLGQWIILALIQLGGLGVMTFTSFFTVFSGKFGIRDRAMMQELMSSETLGEIRRMLLAIIIGTFTIEAVGAFLLTYSWGDAVFQSSGEMLWQSVFHSVSAFCNAGFSLFTANLGDPRVAMNVPVNLIIAGLIILGGIGFPVIRNLFEMFGRRKKFTRRIRLSVHSRLVLVASASLVASAMVLFFTLEFNRSLTGFAFWEQMLASFFQSVTLRTAGFNTVDIAAMGIPMVLIALLWMFIGASPGSTGGGVKTTTFSLLVLSIVQNMRGQKNVEVAHRSIPTAVIDKAYAVVVLHALLIFLSVFLIALFEEFPIIDIIFECISAAGTVGLSRGITAALSDASKFILVVTMIFGRVGVATILVAFIRKVLTTNYDYPSEHIIVG